MKLNRPTAAALFAFLLLINRVGAAALAAPLELPQPEQHLPAVAPAGRPVLGLALEGGGALGLAHIGVIQWLEEHHVPVDRIAGTSMGSLVGASYASGLTPAEMRTLATGNAFQSIFSLQSPYTDLNYRRREDRRDLPQALSVGVRHGVQMRNALLSERGVNEFLAINLNRYDSSTVDYDQLPIPFRCVATDLNELAPVVFRSGPLASAVRASISIPGVFPPVRTADGHTLVDGGIMDNLPADVVRNDLKAQIVIAVYLENSPIASSDTSSIVGVLNRAFSAGIELNVAAALRSADLVIRIPVGRFSGTDYNKGAELIEAGYRAAEANQAALLKLALNNKDWALYLADRESRLRPLPGPLRAVRVVGGTPSAQASVRYDLEQLKDQPIRPVATLKALKPIQSSGSTTATFETFAAGADAQGAAAANPATAGAAKSAGDDGLLVHLHEGQIGPPFLLLEPEIVATTNNPFRTLLGLRVVDQNLGGFGSELRATAYVGTSSSFQAEYYRQLSPAGYFLQPSVAVGREPIYLWTRQQRSAELTQQNLNAGLELGRTFSNTTQASLFWQMQHSSWKLINGEPGAGALTGVVQTAGGRLVIDRRQSSTISPKGWRVQLQAGSFYDATHNLNAPIVQMSFNRTYSTVGENILAIGGQADSYLRRNVAQPFRFSMGGPLHLASASIDEYRSTDQYLARMGYLHRLAALPTGIGQGLYGTVAYEAAEFWNPDQHAALRHDVLTGLVGNTPLGLFTVGFSVGDAGHRKLFLTLGRWF